jgi:hypothetical protein
MGGMDLEERTLETVGERCEECGAALTESELKQAMEAGGPALCTVHAAEVAPLDPDVLDEPAPYPISSTILPSFAPALKRA